jgi:hypothetical protein
MTDDVRAKLAARREACFDRIDDAVSELLALHAVDADEIQARVQTAIDTETRSSAESLGRAGDKPALDE